VEVPAQDVAAAIVADLANQTLTLNDRIARVDEEIEARFFCHPRRRSWRAFRAWVLARVLTTS
jgi:hypothetical protein